MKTYWGVKNIKEYRLLTETILGHTKPVLYETQEKAVQDNLWIDEQPGQWEIIEVAIAPVLRPSRLSADASLDPTQTL